MRFDLATLSLLGALQALLLAPLLLVATRAYTGRARTSLRIWGTVLLLQSLGWLLAALRGQVSDWWSIVLANGVLIVSYAETARALRLLLGVPQRRAWLAAIGLAAWLGIAWFGIVQPDYRTRVCIAAALVGCYLAMLLWPLRHALRSGGSTAQRVMLLVLAGAAVAWCLRLRELATVPQVGLLLATPANVVNMVYGTLEPVFASLGFLLMYNEAAQAELRRLARTDPLTGMLNRLALDEEGQRLFGGGDALAALMLDADHFKAINDRFGHAVGDHVLAALANGIAALLRPGDVLGRAGGEEFLLLLPRSDLASAIALAEVLRAHVATMSLELDRQVQPITVSIGVAVRTPDDRDMAGLVRRADRALYQAKHAGRNRVVAADALVA
ncbi:GGDEF domain-containing protein [Frateuria terrea]|uniref:diguanylate cyclase n=1 Tax=Frateuria terrea TaxID=529704 RepID=A0A1H6X293_9GAMM|nr:GGDEF domain-containing protein [Frateuria terrea]SEJ18882.1 diguanylate cyclase (GGDEF) domain-containing protein [Frateuria terrea]SFP57210.1 diguanylate cyclase (GGDEF) domain-containing protein [Frateuria terrea]